MFSSTSQRSKNKILLGWLLPPKLLMLGESFSISWYILCGYKIRFRFIAFNATFNNISVLSWQSVLLVEETRVQGENHRPVENTLSHKALIAQVVVNSTTIRSRP